MNEEKIKALVDEAMDTETFDVLEYLEGTPPAHDEVTIYRDVAGSRELDELVKQREAVLLRRRRDAERGVETSTLAIVEADDDTEYDTAINELVDRLEKTALTFKLSTVAPKLVRSIEKSYQAKVKPEWTEEQTTKHIEKRNADVLSRAIVQVSRGDGAIDPTPWTAKRLLELEELLYPQQFERLLSALYDIVYTGQVIEDALTVDFS